MCVWGGGGGTRLGVRLLPMGEGPGDKARSETATYGGEGGPGTRLGVRLLPVGGARGQGSE